MKTQAKSHPPTLEVSSDLAVSRALAFLARYAPGVKLRNFNEILPAMQAAAHAECQRVTDLVTDLDADDDLRRAFYGARMAYLNRSIRTGT